MDTLIARRFASDAAAANSSRNSRAAAQHAGWHRTEQSRSARRTDDAALMAHDALCRSVVPIKILHSSIAGFYLDSLSADSCLFSIYLHLYSSTRSRREARPYVHIRMLESQMPRRYLLVHANSWGSLSRAWSIAPTSRPSYN